MFADCFFGRVTGFVAAATGAVFPVPESSDAGLGMVIG